MSKKNEENKTIIVCGRCGVANDLGNYKKTTITMPNGKTMMTLGKCPECGNNAEIVGMNEMNKTN